MDSSSAPTTEENPLVYHPNFSFDDISITSSTTDEFFDTNSFDTNSLSNKSFASSQPSIASYKTEKSINSRKSRYNALPRHKYAGVEHLRPLDPVLSDVEDTSDLEVRKDLLGITYSTMDELFDTNSFDTNSLSNESFASSQTSIASYKTEKSINSRKSRYNALPRHKYAGVEHLRPLDPVLSDVEDTSNLEVRKGHQTLG
jgi:hypothetical protein